MEEIEQLSSELELLKITVSDLESKVSDLYSRPLMPFSSGAASGNILVLGSDLRPVWEAP